MTNAPSEAPRPMDPAPITRHLRAMYTSRLLIAAVCHLKVFEVLDRSPLPEAELRRRLGLPERPSMVLLPALRAIGMLETTASGDLRLTELGRYLSGSDPSNLIGYVALEADDPGVLEMVGRLRNDGPVDRGEGIAYVKEGEEASPMDDPEAARFLTLALAGRARKLAPIVATALPHGEGHLLDVAGGTGLYAYEWLRVNPEAEATIFDRGEVLRVAGEILGDFCESGREGAAGVRDRVRFVAGDMLRDELPRADLLLASSVFHDWPVATCEHLAARFAAALEPGGELWVHDAFLNDSLDGPLAVTDYSAQLFWVTKGRCYSRGEVRDWLAAAGLEPEPAQIPTLMDYGLISARKA